MFFLLFLPINIVVYFLFVYNFTDHYHRVENQLQLINISHQRLLFELHFITHSLSL